jgi:mannose-6-phosphate isomerase-like protein (cupin superfamily)
VAEIAQNVGSMTYSLVSGADAPQVKGRRDYVEYRDLGIEAASNGFMRAQFIGRRKAIAPPTGWHYHTIQAQIIYFLQGWAELAFHDGRRLRAKAGDMLFIPGGVIHNDLISSLDLEVIEMSIPGKMGTVNCEAPPGVPDFQVDDALYREAMGE